ncbi:ankyrin repeat and MYND domain-containing protein 2 [Platysternon megacephalum]|uniref:Ankyrin repeat and MYND domain-containing protein 2 n=1 Tax=Platysternon megacephalum TaxID=55544 RepID=A0A4D9ESY7_9SAUR|nr:ankyrin repeat and MYND domain-containing protein 2 [Platysternon megacephalum]
MIGKSYGRTLSLGQILAKSMTGTQVSAFINMARRRVWACHPMALTRSYCTMWSPLLLLPTPATRLPMPLPPLELLLQSLPTQSIGSNGKELGPLPYPLLLPAGDTAPYSILAS